MSGFVSSEGCNHQRRLRIPQTNLYSSSRFSSNTLGLPDPLWNVFVKSSPWLDTQSQAYTMTYVALLIYVELARCGRCWYRSNCSKRASTVFLHSCLFRSCPGGDINERGRPPSTVQSTAIVAPDHRLLHEKYGLLSCRTIAIEGGQHWRSTVQTLLGPFSCPGGASPERQLCSGESAVLIGVGGPDRKSKDGAG